MEIVAGLKDGDTVYKEVQESTAASGLMGLFSNLGGMGGQQQGGMPNMGNMPQGGFSNRQNRQNGGFGGGGSMPNFGGGGGMPSFGGGMR